MDDSSNVNCIQAQLDEIEVMQSIYGVSWRIEQESGPSNSFAVDIKENGVAVTLHLNLPESYPLHSPPVYNLFAPTLSSLQKNQLKAQLDDVYLENIGQSVLYQWVETVHDFITKGSIDADPTKAVPIQSMRLVDEVSADVTAHDEEANASLIDAVYKSELSKLDKVQSSLKANSNGEEIEIFHGEVITDRKSAFQGHLARIQSVEQVKWVLSRLQENKKIKNATHNMYAYRISLPNSVLIQDCEDDGETQAGSRMLHLLQIMDVKNVIVIVSRWYGGVHLGPDRFRHINNATRQIVEQAGLIKQAGAKS